MGDVDFAWFDQVATECGLTFDGAAAGERRASTVTAAHRWQITSTRDMSSEGPGEYSTTFTTPHAAAPAFEPALHPGAQPVTASVRRDDRTSGSFGGDAVGGLILGAIAGLRRHRKDKATAPQDRVLADCTPEGVVPQAVLDRVAAWPGDAAYGAGLGAPPASTVLARTPEGGLYVTIELTPWTPLTMRTNSFGDGAQFRHAVDTWQLLVEALTAGGALVHRDPATMHPPTAQDVAASMDAARAQLKAYKEQRRQERRG